MVNLSFEISDIVGIYAALISTLVLIWQIITWLKRAPSLKGRALTNYIFYTPGENPSDKQEYVSIIVSNRGGHKTTITNVIITGYKKTWLPQLKRKPIFNAVINHPIPQLSEYSCPYSLGVGADFRCMFEQTDDLTKKLNELDLYIGICHSFSDKPVEFKILNTQK